MKKQHILSALGILAGLLVLGGAAAGLRPPEAAVAAPPAAVGLGIPCDLTGTPTPPACGAGTWSLRAPYPVDIEVPAVVAQGEWLYSFGGIVNTAATTAAYAYNPDSDTWTAIAPLPAPRAYASAVSDGTYIYIVNGQDEHLQDQTSLYRYDPAANTYMTLAPSPLATSMQAAAYLNGKIYRVGGSPTVITHSVDVYTVAGNSWAAPGTVAPYPIAVVSLALTSFAGYLYTAGGYVEDPSPPQNTAKTYRYDPAGNTWDDQAIADLPAGRCCAASGLLNWHWILAGGYAPGGNSAVALDLNWPTGSWDVVPPMPASSQYPAGAASASAFYAVGGWGLGQNSPTSQDTQRYVETPCPTGTPTLTVTGTPPTATPTPTSTITPIPTIGCCPAPGGALLPNCWMDPETGAFGVSYYLEIYNFCSSPIAGTIQDSLSLSPDNVHWDVVATGVPHSISIPPYTPGPPPVYYGGLSIEHLPDEYRYYQIGASVQRGAGCGSFGFGAGPYPICRPLATPSPTPTDTPICAQTPGPPTATPCPIRFSDVHPADYFYGPVRDLACRGVLSGYGDGTFRPYNPATRAQMIKIVVLAFDLTVATPQDPAYTFADVPPGFPFFTVVETAAARGIVGGYSCGGPGEPCDDAHRPYFRPYASVTRGQLAKIVAVAAGWAPYTPANPTFADVAPGSPFYAFIEAAAGWEVISGYSCGGPGEPCDESRRPYFRPAANATRGQIARIVSTALTASGPCSAAIPSRR